MRGILTSMGAWWRAKHQSWSNHSRLAFGSALCTLSMPKQGLFAIFLRLTPRENIEDKAEIILSAKRGHFSLAQRSRRSYSSGVVIRSSGSIEAALEPSECLLIVIAGSFGQPVVL